MAISRPMFFSPNANPELPNKQAILQCRGDPPKKCADLSFHLEVTMKNDPDFEAVIAELRRCCCRPDGSCDMDALRKILEAADLDVVVEEKE